MKRLTGPLLVALLACPLSGGATAHAACAEALPWSRLGNSAAELTEPTSLLLSAGALVVPVTASPTGVDHRLRLLAQRDLGGRYDAEPLSVYAPFVLAGGLAVGVGLSASFDACAWQRPQAAMLQAVVLTAATVAFLKVATGRNWPNGGGDPSAPDRLDRAEWSRDFRPFRAGLAAWPSGHTAVMIAAASALRATAPELGWLRYAGYPLTVGVAAGMWLGDHHWASDIVSGALLGEAIGGAVGRSFADDQEAAELALLPLPGGAAIVYLSPW